MASNKKIVLNDISVIDHHIQCILRSGLLVDVDAAYVRVCYDSRMDYYNDERFPLYQKWAATVSLSSAVLVIQKKCPISYIPLCAAPIAIVGVKHLVEFLHRRKRRNDMLMLIQSISDSSKLNGMIYEYLNFRKKSSESSVPIIEPYTKRIEDFIHNIFLQEIYVFESFKMCVGVLGNYIPGLKDRYPYLEDEFFEDFRVSNVKNMDDCVACMDKLRSIYTLITSHCLTCLAVCLCPDKWDEYKYNVDDILDIIVIQLKDTSRACYNKTKKMFDDVKYHYLNRTEPKTECKPPKPDTDTKLYLSVSKSMMHTSDILEKSKIVLEKLQRGDMQTAEKEQLIDCIAVLCREVYDFYESLEVLHKLFEIKTHPSKPVGALKPTSSNDTPLLLESGCENKEVNTNANEPNSDDEEFEAYVPANDVPSATTSSTAYYEEEQEKRRLASLLSMELKHKLKTDSRFVAARTKRGITDEKPETEKGNNDEEPQTSGTEKGSISEEPGTSGIKKPKTLMTRPPPPPLPPVNWGPQGDCVDSPPPNAFLEALKAASKSRSTVEEVFDFAGETEEEATHK